MSELTTDTISSDTLFNGKLHCKQHLDGYRFSIDPVLLAHFVQVKKDDTILDLGTGCGVIPIILLFRYSSYIKQIFSLELQKKLATLAENNFKTNHFEKQCTLVEGDVKNIKELVEPEAFNTVVCNPPFYPVDDGRLTKNKEANIARHQITATLHDFLVAAAFSVKNKGAVYFIYPAKQTTTFLETASSVNLTVKKMRFIYNYPKSSDDAALALFHCTKNGLPGVRIAKPLYIYQEKNGSYSPEVTSYYEG